MISHMLGGSRQHMASHLFRGIFVGTAFSFSKSSEAASRMNMVGIGPLVLHFARIRGHTSHHPPLFLPRLEAANQKDTQLAWKPRL